MKFYVVSCEVFARECARAAANSPHIVHTSFQAFGLHDTPDELRKKLQEEIDRSSGARFDYILLVYGLCSGGTAELTARDTPLVITRAHDCITLLLGSRQRYEREFREQPGTYYYSPGWIERKDGEVRQGTIQAVKQAEAERRFQEYVEKYGEDNARYLMEQEGLWLANYSRAAFINVGLGDIENYRRFTRGVAESHGWSYEEIEGDTRLIECLVRGEWDSGEFLIVKPGQRTIQQVADGIMTVE